jgi:2-polyprenyl-3-methyl-5-hydroxy-6-metoxy-1,4-benzoquinol methylase
MIFDGTSLPDVFWPDLSQRVSMPELMDDPCSDPVRLERTLRQFVIINRLLTRMRYLASRVFVRDMLRRPGRCHTVADLGAGGGDFGRWLIRHCRARGLRVKVLSVDNDPRVAEFAREQCRGWDAIQVVERDARDVLAQPDGIDYIFANHFLHHIPDEAIPRLLQAIDRAAGRAFVLNDITRTHWAYLGFTLLSAPLRRYSFAFYDGRLSIRRGFTLCELREHVRRAGLSGSVAVDTCKPSRLYVWRGPKGPTC